MARLGQGCHNEGVPFTFRNVVAIKYSARKLKWSAKTALLEYEDLARFLGDGFGEYLVDVYVTWHVPGREPVTDTIAGCFVGLPSIKSTLGDAAMVKFGSRIADVLTGGSRVFESVKAEPQPQAA